MLATNTRAHDISHYILEISLYPEMKINNIFKYSSCSLYSSNSDEMETFLFDFSPKFYHFCANSRYLPDLQGE